MNLIANIGSPADDRFFYRLNKGLMHEKRVEAISKVFKKFVFTGICIVLPVVASLVLVPLNFPIAALVSVAAAIILGSVFICVAEYSKKRERLAHERSNNMRLIFVSTNEFKEALNEDRFPLYTFVNDSNAKFLKRVGVISRRSFWRIKAINFATHGKLSGVAGMIKRRIFCEDRWEEIRTRLLNDLPSESMLQEIIL